MQVCTFAELSSATASAKFPWGRNARDVGRSDSRGAGMAGRSVVRFPWGGNESVRGGQIPVGREFDRRSARPANGPTLGGVTTRAQEADNALPDSRGAGIW